MSQRKQRPQWPLLAATLIGLPVLYVASFGPACWIVRYAYEHGHLGDMGFPIRAYLAVYAPLIWLKDYGPVPLAETLRWYAGLLS